MTAPTAPPAAAQKTTTGTKRIKTPLCNTYLKYLFNKTYANVFVFQTAACLGCATMAASETFFP